MTTVDNSGARLRPTSRLQTAQASARSAAETLVPSELGSARQTRHSFARSFIRAAAGERWNVIRERFDVDPIGRGEVIYRVDIGERTYRFIAFCGKIAESERIDRVVARSWDVTAALTEGDLSPERMAELRREVPQQEHGRADAQTIVWTRANRSARYFDYVAQRLAQGLQPSVDVLGDSGYIMRSTAFYGNGKWGLADFAQFDDDHPFAIPYRAQMLTAWLLRELSYDLVEHCASTRSSTAVRLNGTWRRFFGLGNATGLGMVPYIINHPQVLDAWVALRELPLSYALSCPSQPDSKQVARVIEVLSRAQQYFAERDTLQTAPFTPYPMIADDLADIVDLARLYQSSGAIGERRIDFLPAELHAIAGSKSAEVRQVVDSALVECHPEIDDDIELLLRCDELTRPTLAQSCQTFLTRVRSDYAWALDLSFQDPGSRRHFWHFSVNNQEPRRGVRGQSAGESMETPVGIAHAVTVLADDLAQADPHQSLVEFLVACPWHRGIIDRVQDLAGIPYGEVHANLLDQDFVPLDLQRFQLAVFGMENFSPQSTDWLRVTLFGGAPRAADISAGVDDDWLFSLKPTEES